MKCGTKRGAPPESAGSADPAPAADKTQVAKKDDEEPSASREELVNQITEMVKKLQAGPKPGLSHNAKKWKDQLKEDPYNLESMYRLGVAYAQDEHWEKCANVMIRGLKRMEEFKEIEQRYDYLYTLCQASLRVRKYQQALLVLKEMKLPEDETFTELEVLQCQVYCANGDAQKGIKNFHEAIKDKDFTDASAVWAMCHMYLRKVEAYDICKQAIEAIAAKEDDPDAAQKKLAVLESIAALKDSAKDDASATPPWWTIAKYAGVLYLFFVIYVLYYLEGRSLAGLKIRT